MSLLKNLKTRGQIDFSNPVEVPSAPVVQPSPPPLPVKSESPASTIKDMTPGGLARTVAAQRNEVLKQNEDLKKQIVEWESAKVAKLIDSKLIAPSKWANRHDDSFRSDEFLALKDEIESAGVNLQPIKIRSVRPSNTLPHLYEIVFGHRRHRACLELGLPVLALLEDITDEELFTQMDRENRQRADLRPFEQGMMYARALDEGLFTSLRKLSEKLGVSISNASEAVKVARLPGSVLGAFVSPLDVQVRWAKLLTDAVEANPDVLLATAKEISQERAAGSKVSSLDAFNRLCGIVKKPDSKSSHIVKYAGKKAFKVSVSAKKVDIELPAMNDAALEKLEEAILEALKGEGVLR